MLALWSRAVQIRGSCRCPQCLSAAQGVARSTTTSAGRRPQYWTSSTLWYSGIFAAAASWDAAIKVQRREKWDQAIAEIKEELGEYDGLEDVLSRQVLEERKEKKEKAKYGYTLHELAGHSVRRRERKGDVQEWQKQRIVDRPQHDTDSLNMAAVIKNDSETQEESPVLSPFEQHEQYVAMHAQNEGSQEHKTQEQSHVFLPFEQQHEQCAPTPIRGEGSPECKHNGASTVAVFEGDQALQELAANTDSSRQRKKKPNWPMNTASDANPKHLPPQSIYAPDYVKKKHEAQGWTAYKVERCMISTDLFLLRTWKELRRKGLSQEAADAVPSEYANYLLMSEPDLQRGIAQKEADLDRLERLGKKRFLLGWFTRAERDVPLCRYHADHDGEGRDITLAMNETIRNLFEQTRSGTHTIPTLMAQISYNLSRSTAPPNIDTYNSLLVGLFDLRQVKHTEHVIHSMLRTRARPNEVTLATVLNFHSSTGDASNFRWWVQRMRGGFDGLMNASPRTKISPLTGNRLIHRDDGKNDGLGTIIQLPYPTPMVFGALIHGVLNFSGFEAALRICEHMAHEGWGLCITGLGIILRNCAERKDWTSGLTIWKQIQALKWKSTRYINSSWTSETIGIQTFVTMLQLCARCGQRNVFEDIMDQAAQAHPRAVTKVMEHVRNDQPYAAPLRLGNENDEPTAFTSLDAVAPAWKPPIDMLTMQLMPDDFSAQNADRGEDAVHASELDIRDSEYREHRQETPYPRLRIVKSSSRVEND